MVETGTHNSQKLNQHETNPLPWRELTACTAETQHKWEDVPRVVWVGKQASKHLEVSFQLKKIPSRIPVFLCLSKDSQDVLLQCAFVVCFSQEKHLLAGCSVMSLTRN